MKNDVTDFLLKEYELVAKAYFDSRDITTRWFKYYLLIIAAPLSFIAVTYNGKYAEFNIFKMGPSLGFIILFIGLFCILFFKAILYIGLDAVLYARTVNGIRKVFLENDNNGFNYAKYRVLPIDIKLPEMYKYSGHLFTLITCMALMNSIYVFLGLIQFKCHVIYYVFCFIVSFLIFCLHFKLYKSTCKWKEKTYSLNEP